MKKMLLVLSIILGINNAMAQETTNPFDFLNFDFQAYQVKLQKFLETLTPQERIIFIMSQSKSSSNSSKECELDSSTKNKIDKIDKIDKIYDKLEDMDRRLRNGSYSLDCDCNCY